MARLQTFSMGVLGVAAVGCIDFDRFVFSRDGSVLERPDGPSLDLALPDTVAPSDVTGEAPAEATVLDRLPVGPTNCQPGRWSVTQLRVAHMAPEVGPIDVCMQKRGRVPTTSMTRFQTPLWPAEGLEYGQVSRSVPLNMPVATTNEAWDIAVVARGTPCERVPGETLPLAIRSIQLDPGTLRLVVITAEPALDGHLVPFINLLTDENCTDCPSGTVDVRAVHASLGASSQRLTFSILPQAPWNPPSSVQPMRTFAAGVSYGVDQGYACNQLWASALTVESRSNPPAQFEVSTAGGRLVARSETLLLKRAQLAATRTVTVFFEGGLLDPTGASAWPLGFVVCYDGSVTGLLSNCERVTATPLTADAGADAVSDSASDTPPDNAAGAPPQDVTDDLVASTDPPDTSVP
jgi:hypothetical protein